MPFYKWSQTASANGTADPTCPFPEGMAPSAVNDGVRGAMAALAQYRDDMAGAIVTAGTNTAYSVSSYQVFDSFADMNGKTIAFSPHTINGAGPVTLNVDSLGAKPLRFSPGVDLPSGTILQGTPYLALYNNTTGEFYLHGGFQNPYNIPLLGGLDYWSNTTPNSSFVFPTGQAISRTVYAAAFAMVGTLFGAGDGSTTFNLPDKRGRVSAGVDSMNGVAANVMPGFSLGFMGGAENFTLSQAQLPPVNLSISGNTSGYTPTINGGACLAIPGGSTPEAETQTGAANTFASTAYGVIAGFSSLSVTGNTSFLGSGSAISLLQPTIACNYIIRIM
jgi:microcystin-dependent protein